LYYSWDAREGQEAVLVEFERYSDRPKPTPLWHQVWNHIEDAGVQLFGIDTAAVVFGGSENFRGQVTNFMRILVQQAHKHNAAIILTAHPSKSGPNSYSGSTAWLGSSRFAMSMGRPKEYDEETGEPWDQRVLRGLKANYSSGHHLDKLRWEKGVFVMDGVQTHRYVTAQDRRDLDYRLLAFLRQLLGNGTRVMADTTSSNSLGKLGKRHMTDLPFMPLREFDDSAARLISSGQVVRVDVRGHVLVRPADMVLAGEKPWKEP
jgi:RecA-family ATPase